MDTWTERIHIRPLTVISSEEQEKRKGLLVKGL